MGGPMAGYAVAHLDEIEEIADVGCRYPIAMSEEFRDSAKDDSDLDPIRDEPAFKQLISG
jgi:hypothetical protein